MLVSLSDVNEIAETRNCSPHSLPNATDEPSKFNVGIFSFFAVPQNEKMTEEVFAAAHDYTFEKAAALFDIPYARVERASELASLFGKTQVIEITTTRKENVSLHNALDQCLSSCMVS